LAPIVATPEYIDELPTLIPIQLPYFNANYVENRSSCPLYPNLLESGFLGLFFSDSIVEIILKETNAYTEYQIQQPPLSLYSTR
jgi:hypothetical protein